jgi:hypothetical protein
MVWLYFAASVLFIAAEVWSFTVGKKRTQALLAHLKAQHPAAYASHFAGAKAADAALGDFLRSRDDFGDPEVARLKRRALAASKYALMPFLALLALMVAAYVAGAVMSFFK